MHSFSLAKKSRRKSKPARIELSLEGRRSAPIGKGVSALSRLLKARVVRCYGEDWSFVLQSHTGNVVVVRHYEGLGDEVVAVRYNGKEIVKDGFGGIQLYLDVGGVLGLPAEVSEGSVSFPSISDLDFDSIIGNLVLKYDPFLEDMDISSLYFGSNKVECASCSGDFSVNVSSTVKRALLTVDNRLEFVDYYLSSNECSISYAEISDRKQVDIYPHFSENTFFGFHLNGRMFKSNPFSISYDTKTKNPGVDVKGLFNFNNAKFSPNSCEAQPESFSSFSVHRFFPSSFSSLTSAYSPLSSKMPVNPYPLYISKNKTRNPSIIQVKYVPFSQFMDFYKYRHMNSIKSTSESDVCFQTLAMLSNRFQIKDPCSQSSGFKLIALGPVNFDLNRVVQFRVKVFLNPRTISHSHHSKKEHCFFTFQTIPLLLPEVNSYKSVKILLNTVRIFRSSFCFLQHAIGENICQKNRNASLLDFVSQSLFFKTFRSIFSSPMMAISRICSIAKIPLVIKRKGLNNLFFNLFSGFQMSPMLDKIKCLFKVFPSFLYDVPISFSTRFPSVFLVALKTFRSALFYPNTLFFKLKKSLSTFLITHPVSVFFASVPKIFEDVFEKLFFYLDNHTSGFLKTLKPVPVFMKDLKFYLIEGKKLFILLLKCAYNSIISSRLFFLILSFLSACLSNEEDDVKKDII